MNVLISGAGITGLTLAYWLHHHGIACTVVESANTLRTGGYVVHFWGGGYDVAEKMGLLPELYELGYQIQSLRFVGRNHRQAGGLSASVINTLLRGRFLSVERGELAAALARKVPQQVEMIFGDSIVACEQTSSAVQVKFARGGVRHFDLVIGADGVHSNLRRLVFGKDDSFEHSLGYSVAAFRARAYRPRDENAYVVYSQVDKQLLRFAMRNDDTLFLFVFADGRSAPMPSDLTIQKDILKKQFAAGGWECPAILEALEAAPSLFIDRISQIRMDTWSKGRVALAGDAAFCPSLLSAQGSSLGMLAAYTLASELSRAKDDHVRAFANYENALRALSISRQRAAVTVSGILAPRSQFGLVVRNTLSRMLAVPWIASRLTPLLSERFANVA